MGLKIGIIIVASVAISSCGRGKEATTQAAPASPSSTTPSTPACSSNCSAFPAVSVCGNSIAESDEQCDDGNTNAGDGCSADCKTIEANFACIMPGQPCVVSIVCGDSQIGGDETCDDGNTVGNDGCDSTCHVEAGWACVDLGAACEAAACGDGIVAGNETCEDGNPTPVSGDGCSAQCQLEEGWKCDVVGAACQVTVCGDHVREGTEQCDDGNHDLGDGCTPFCKREPDCSQGACVSVCGDGIRLSSDAEQCEDGNTRAGDGCDAQCQIEAGFTCTPVTTEPTELNLPLVVRDFKQRVGSCWSAPNPTVETCGHPDFEYSIGTEANIVATALGSTGKPAYAKEGLASATTHNTQYFDLWYRDTTNVNQTFLQTITLGKQSSGVFQYNNSSFYPIDNLGFGNQGNSHNYHFTSEVRYWFEYKGGEQLDFTGDDDVWVFINKKRAIDLGGVHGAQSASVLLDAAKATELGLEVGKIYETVVFQAERHTTQSNYRLTLSNFANAITQCTTVCGDGIRTPNEACDDGIIDGSYGHCNSNCTRAPHCGDAILQSDQGELCDDGKNVTPYGTTGCAPLCKTPAKCGDGHVDAIFGEQCDDGNVDNNDQCTSTCQNQSGYAVPI